MFSYFPNILVFMLLYFKRLYIVNPKTAYDTTPLHYASRNGQLDCVKLLVECGCDINAADKGGWTPLHYGCSRGHIKTCDFLITNGASVDGMKLSQHSYFCGCKY